jgi:SHS2 domain-containing protein
MVFRQLEHTADLALEVEAPSLGELFAEALRGLADCVTEVEHLAPRVWCRLEARAPDRERLLVEWLGEALYRFEIERLLFCAATVEILETSDGWEARGEAAGERFDPERHPYKVALKGVTYHGLRVEPRGGGWRARMVFDL